MKSFPSLKFAVLSGGLVALSAFVSPMYGALIVQTATYHASDYSGSVMTNGYSDNPIDRLELTSAFNPFNSALGSLDSATVALSLTFQIDWTDPNPSSSPSISGGVDIYWDWEGSGESAIWGTGGGNGTGPSSTGSLTMSMSTSAVTPGSLGLVLADFDNPYTLSLVSDGMQVGGSNGATVDYLLKSGSLSVTYDYTAIPEPASYTAWVGFLAFSLFFVGRRRNR